MKFLDPRLFRYSRSSRGFISVVVALALLTTLLTLLQAFTITSVVVDAFQKEKSWVNLQPQIRNLAFIFGLRALIAFFGDSLTRKIGAKIRVELRTQLFNQALSQGTELNLKFGYGKLSLIATRGIAALEPYFNKFMPQLFIALTVPFIVGVTITLKDLASGLIILGTIPLIPIFGILIGKYTSEAMAKKWRTMGILSSYVVDLFAGLLTLKVYGRSKHQKNRIKEVGNQYRVETMKVLKISFLSSLVLELIATLSVALIAVWIGLRLVSGNISLSNGLLVLLLAPEVYWPIRQVSAQFHASAEGLESSREIFEVLEMKPQSKGHRNTLNRLREIRWESLIIEYPNRASIQIPRGSAKSGEITLLVGQSGSGKTSLINTLMGLVNPIKGKVWINNINSAYPLHEFDNDFWLSQISWVSQTPHFPHGTIAEIFDQLKPGISKSELIETLNKVGLEIADLPKGTATLVGDNESGISVGQLRRLAIARALITDRPIVLMDEPTASLDEAAEDKISEVLLELARSGKLVIAVSHREALTVHAQKMVHFGELIEIKI